MFFKRLWPLIEDRPESRGGSARGFCGLPGMCISTTRGSPEEAP